MTVRGCATVRPANQPMSGRWETFSVLSVLVIYSFVSLLSSKRFVENQSSQTDSKLKGTLHFRGSWRSFMTKKNARTNPFQHHLPCGGGAGSYACLLPDLAKHCHQNYDSMLIGIADNHGVGSQFPVFFPRNVLSESVIADRQR